MKAYEIKTADGKVYPMSAEDPIEACQRVADLYRVNVIAWRQPSWDLCIVHPSAIIG